MTSPENGGDPAIPPDLEQAYEAIAKHRRWIDRIDPLIRLMTIPMGKLIEWREHHSDKIGDIKVENNIPVLQPGRHSSKEEGMVEGIDPEKPRFTLLSNLYNSHGVILFRSLDRQYKQKQARSTEETEF